MNATTWTAVAIPSVLLLGAACVSPRRPFRVTSLAATASLVLALVAAASPFGAESTRFVRLDAVGRVLLVLVAFIAAVIVRYSRSYLHGDPGQVRYVRALLLTLASVDVLVLSNDLLVLALAWTGASISLHGLLTFYRERPQARVVAHKKFLLSRLADASLLSAIWLLARGVGTLRIDEIDAWATRHAALTAPMQTAAVLVVLAVALKSAQLPFHGWLIQVMEAPTPVSALLHAGVVNIGGFVMIRLSPLMARAPAAQTLLVIVGTTTAVVAPLVMTTRVSVKVALAWSTCGQMGLMLVECGLGAWSLALLHLIAHSLYKAHAFLSAGSVVDGWRVQALSPRPPPITRARLVSIALRGAGVLALYGASHAAVDRVFVFPEAPVAPVARIVALTGFALLLVASVALEWRPEGALARSLQPRLFAGFYLDEIFTRLTFRLWPPKLPRGGEDDGAPHRLRSRAPSLEVPR
jgi:NAD(P)H-quinone oxidoreductase subunit 5